MPETSRRFSCIRQDIRCGRRYEFTGRILPELETAVLVARVFGTREKEKDVKKYVKNF